MVQCERLSDHDRLLNDKLYTTYIDFGIEDGWFREDKLENFQTLVMIEKFTRQPLAGTSVLDVGCGTGDMSAFLRKKGVTKYRGVDILPKVICFAKMKYPKERFVLADFLTVQFAEQYDYALLSGTLATKFVTDNYEVMEATQ